MIIRITVDWAGVVVVPAVVVPVVVVLLVVVVPVVCVAADAQRACADGKPASASSALMPSRQLERWLRSSAVPVPIVRHAARALRQLIDFEVADVLSCAVAAESSLYSAALSVPLLRAGAAVGADAAQAMLMAASAIAPLVARNIVRA